MLLGPKELWYPVSCCITIAISDFVDDDFVDNDSDDIETGALSLTRASRCHQLGGFPCRNQLLQKRGPALLALY
jgi:hypothetical protein